jgi:hypothetical protein
MPAECGRTACRAFEPLIILFHLLLLAGRAYRRESTKSQASKHLATASPSDGGQGNFKSQTSSAHPLRLNFFFSFARFPS